MARITRDVTLKHQANLGEETEEVAFAAGDEVTVLKEWEGRALCKSADGKLFNVPKEYLEG
jgi:hypothetical protein